jgi:hypothetical protein
MFALNLDAGIIAGADNALGGGVKAAGKVIAITRATV